MLEHWDKLEKLLGKPLIRLTNKTLDFWIEEFHALPNWRQRWCTRLLKIEPTIAFIKSHQPSTLYVGLRADEEERKGIYSEDVISRFPLREWGWGIKEVWQYLKERDVTIPERTDCARCYGQRLIEWKRLWQKHPEIYADAERQEQEIGATFRSPGRDTWPAQLVQLRAEFEAGRKVRGEDKEDSDDGMQSCRVCRL
jgi:3'-phosphoadenosine 5'-phosphosulfate sulfotransferase (PAPS reductase)/FAD synthetase